MNCILFRVIQHNTTNMGHVSPNILKTLIIKKIKRWNKVKNCYNLCDNYSKILCSHIGCAFFIAFKSNIYRDSCDTIATSLTDRRHLTTEKTSSIVA